MARKIVTFLARIAKRGVRGKVCSYCNGPVGYGAGRWWGENCDHEGSY